MIGWAFCGSFCTVDKAVLELERMKKKDGIQILPIFSENFQKTDTRFGKASEKIEAIEVGESNHSSIAYIASND